MLSSKYVTPDGIRLLLQGIYDIGYEYVYYDPGIKHYMMSLNEPVFDGDEFINCVGNCMSITNIFLIDILSDIMEKGSYIRICDYISTVDWSKVPVDAKVIVDADCFGPTKEHFAKYEDGKVYVWANYRTSWSAFNEDDVISLPANSVHLADEDN